MKKNIPKLRFKEFTEEWEEGKLNNYIVKNTQKNKDLKYSYVQSISNKYGLINQKDYFNNREIASKDLSNYYVIKNEMFAYNPCRIDVGSLAFKRNQSTSIISPLYVSFECKTEKLIPLFLLTWFNSKKFMRQRDNSLQGSVRNTLNFSALVNISVDLPSKEEQKKIGKFLSLIDKRIELLKKEEENFNKYKKGLLQKMFVF